MQEARGTICFVQKDRKIDILRKHIAMKREMAEREQERQRRDTEPSQREDGNYNGTCRYIPHPYTDSRWLRKLVV